MYEGDDDFAALPTFGVIPQFLASGGMSFNWLPNYNPVGFHLRSRAIFILVVSPPLWDFLTHLVLRRNCCMVNNISLSKVLYPQAASSSMSLGQYLISKFTLDEVFLMSMIVLD